MISRTSRWVRRLSLALALILTFSTLTALGAGLALNAAAASSVSIADAAPEGTVNVAVGATVTASKCSANKAGSINSYEMPTERWCLANLTDGDLNNGWSTDPYDREMNRNAPVTLTMELQEPADVSAVALFPFGAFPEAYTLSLSMDGRTWTKVAESKGNPASPSTPNVHTFKEMRAQYVLVEVSIRSKNVTPDGALAQFAEIAVYGKEDTAMKFDRPALELEVGETDQLSVTYTGSVQSKTVTWKSDNTAVVTVDAEGRLTAKKTGSALVTATNTAGGMSVTCPVTVVEKHVDLDDNIMISIFWPPTPDYITDEQYKLIADAGVNWVMGAGEETLATPANQQKVLALAAKYGLKVIVNDGSFGGSLANKSEEQIAALVNKYKNVPGVGGFYILDEPLNPNAYVNAYTALKKACPEGVMHLNFLPSGVYGSEITYKAQINDWCRLCAANGFPVDYVIYDRYPFGLQAGSMDRAGFFTNMRSVHDAALENGVRTGTYIQTVRQSVAFRRPTDSEIRFEMYAALAYGFKQLSFFTWFTPVNRSEPFEDGIISADGVPNAHYETIKTINHEILTIGSILAKCEAEEIYLAGGDTFGQPSVPADFFIQPGARKMTFTLSLMKHKETGRNYVMVVNNNFSKAQDVTLKLDPSVKALWEVSRSDGSLVPLTIENNELKLSMAAGDGMLIALPEGMDFVRKSDAAPADGANLAAGAMITASQSQGSAGCYINYLNDGHRFSEQGFNGWRSTGRTDVSVTLDFGQARTFNRVDLYPFGSLVNFGENFPKEVTLSVSDDGSTWKTIHTATGLSVGTTAPSLTFDAVTARYLRLTVDKCSGSTAALAEIEVYNDNGTLPPPAVFSIFSDDGPAVTYTEGQDIAKGKKAYASSSAPDNPYKQWGWSLDFINDGNTNGTGWTSNVKANASADSVEYVIIDLGDVFSVEQVVVTVLGCFPENYKIQLSDDARTWKNFASFTKAAQPSNGDQLTYEADAPVSGRFLRFYATRLRGTQADGYMLQLGNISAYGHPVCDKTALTEAVDTYRTAGGDENAAELAEALAGLDNALLTQSQARKLAAALLALIAPPETEPETDPVTEPATEPDTAADPVTEPITEPESGKDTEPAGTQTPESETEGGKSSGCSSTLAAGAVLLSAAGAAVTAKKKKED